MSLDLRNEPREEMEAAPSVSLQDAFGEPAPHTTEDQPSAEAEPIGETTNNDAGRDETGDVGESGTRSVPLVEAAVRKAFHAWLSGLSAPGAVSNYLAQAANDPASLWRNGELWVPAKTIASAVVEATPWQWREAAGGSRSLAEHPRGERFFSTNDQESREESDRIAKRQVQGIGLARAK